MSTSSTPSDPTRCSRCGAAKPAGAPCPHCLLQLGLALAPDPAQASSAPRRQRIPPDPAEIARHFPGLDIQETIGQGGMGVVYRARQRKLDRLVALKILAPELSDDPAFAERFLREARAMARLDHAHIVAIHDFGETDGLCWLLMEYVDGVNLREALKSGALTPERALAIVPQLCDALQSAHELGVVHRDIKPENVLIGKDGTVKVADFGLAKLSDAAGLDETLTNASVAMGTVHYMAPEQLRGAHAVDHRADIFSLGVVFYEMLTGALPIGRFDPPSRRVDVDVRLDEIVLRALEQQPERRYQHAVEVKTDVQGLRRSEPSPAARSEGAARADAGAPAFAATSAAAPAVDAGSKPRQRMFARRAHSPNEMRAIVVGFGFTLALLPSIARTGWRFGPIGIGVVVAVTAVWLMLFALHRVERDAELRAEMRARTKTSRALGKLSFLALAAAGLLTIGAGLLGALELGTDHYMSPAPFANARVEPWSDDQGYALLRRLPASELAAGAELPELGEPEMVRYFRKHAPAPGPTLLAGFLLLGLASLAGFLPRGRWTPGVALTPPLAMLGVVALGYGITQIRQLGGAPSMSGITGSAVIHGRLEGVREALLAELRARGDEVHTRVERKLVAKRSREPIATHVLLVTEPASIFEAWSLEHADPMRVEPALCFELTSAIDGSATHVLWDAGLLRIGERIGDGWRKRIERTLEGVRTRVGDR